MSGRYRAPRDLAGAMAGRVRHPKQRQQSGEPDARKCPRHILPIEGHGGDTQLRGFHPIKPVKAMAALKPMIPLRAKRTANQS